MFNTTIIKSPETIRVYEHRAPTDDSIRLAQETRDKVLAGVISDYRFDDNVVKGRVVVIKNPVDLSQTIIIKASVNGKQIEVREDWGSILGVSRHDAARLIVEAVSRSIAIELLSKLMANDKGAFQ